VLDDVRSGMTQDIRQAARRLLRTPAFTLAAVVTLGLAIGANGSIFAVVQHVVLNPLPYPESDRLVEVDHGVQAVNVPNGLGVTRGLYLHYAERARTLESLAAYDEETPTLTGAGEPEQIATVRATPSLGRVLQVMPALGRWFTAQEGTPGASAVAVLSHGFWVRRYGASSDLVGRAITLDGVPTTVIGVMPQNFAFPAPGVDAWTVQQLSRAAGFGTWEYKAVARLRVGVTPADARAELRGMVASVIEAYPGDPLARAQMQANPIFIVRTLKEATVGTIARSLWILLAAVALVLLVACANLANLFLVRFEARQRDVAVRRALGSGRRGIAAYFLSESALLALAGGMVGLALAFGAVQTLVAIGPPNLPRLSEIRVDAIVIAFTFGLALITGVTFGVAPLLHGAPLAATLHEGGRSHTASRRRHHARRVLMGTQVAFALVLLIASGLMVRSFQELRAVDPGFDAASTLTFTVGLPQNEYPTRAAAAATHQAILDRVSALPGVARASATTCLPLAGGCHGNTVLIEGRAIPPGDVPPVALFRGVAADYFAAMGTPLRAGRGLTREDVDQRQPVAVISESFARATFPSEDPIGRRVASNLPPVRRGEAPALEWLTIVGVVANTPIRTPGENFATPHLYMPMTIAGGPDIPRLVGPNVAAMTYVVRTSTPPLGLVRAARQAIDGINPQLPIAQVSPMQVLLDRASAQTAFMMVLLATAAAVALLLGLIGIYGVMSYIVTQRTGEIGLRLALGAQPREVAGMIVRQGGAIALAGIAVGLGAALAGSRLLESLLFNVGPRDPGVFVATTVALLVVAVVACWVPARRAARMSPVEALRADG
jgi:predicted permease